MSNYCLQQRTLFVLEQILFCLDYCVHATCVCAHHDHCILNCVNVWKRRNTIWLVIITCAWLARVFGTTPNEEGFKERRMYICTVCLCLCAHAWVKLCVLILFVWAYVVAVIVLTCCRVLACNWRQQVVRVGAVAPRVYFNLFLALGGRNPTKDLRKSHKSPFVVVLNITLCSLYVNISAVRTTA